MSVITLLQAMQVIDDTLRMRGSGKDRALFIVKHLGREPKQSVDFAC